MLNVYINEARNALHNDPEYRHVFDNMLVRERVALMEKGCNPYSLEYALDELRSLELDYILEHKAELDAQLMTGNGSE